MKAMDTRARLTANIINKEPVMINTIATGTQTQEHQGQTKQPSQLPASPQSTLIPSSAIIANPQKKQLNIKPASPPRLSLAMQRYLLESPRDGGSTYSIMRQRCDRLEGSSFYHATDMDSGNVITVGNYYCVARMNVGADDDLHTLVLGCPVISTSPTLLHQPYFTNLCAE